MEPLWSVRSYAKAIGAALLIMGVGYIIVAMRAPVTPASGGTWTGSGALLGGTAQDTSSAPRSSAPAQQPILGTVTSSAPFVYTTPSGQAAQANPNTDGPDLAALVAQFMPKNGPAAQIAPGTATNFFDAYTFVPAGLIATTTEKARSQTQQKLYDYGNEAGSYIQDYESLHRNVPQIAQDHIADRSNPEKRTALISVANDLIALGKQLAQVEEVPSAVSAEHKAIAAGYQSIGHALIPVAEAQRDQDFLAAITAYNATVDAFTKHYVALVLLFPSYGVSFSSNDPGSAFSFSQSP